LKNDHWVAGFQKFDYRALKLNHRRLLLDSYDVPNTFNPPFASMQSMIISSKRETMLLVDIAALISDTVTWIAGLQAQMEDLLMAHASVAH